MSLKFVDIDFNKLSAKEVCEFGYRNESNFRNFSIAIRFLST